jgi:hypothetical protein
VRRRSVQREERTGEANTEDDGDGAEGRQSGAHTLRSDGCGPSLLVGVVDEHGLLLKGRAWQAKVTNCVIHLSTTTPTQDHGVIRPLWLAADSVNQSAPSGPMVI